MKEQLLKLIFLNLTMRFSSVLAIHKQEYVNDLLQLTLNAKAVRKLVFLIEGTGRA
jgi:hypothetical protein